MNPTNNPRQCFNHLGESGNLSTEALEALSPPRTAPNASASPILGAIRPFYPLWVGQRNGNRKIDRVDDTHAESLSFFTSSDLCLADS